MKPSAVGTDGQHRTERSCLPREHLFAFLLLLSLGPVMAQETDPEHAAPPTACRRIADDSTGARPTAACTEASMTPLGELRSPVLAPAYWDRLGIEQWQIQTRFNVHPVGGLALGRVAAAQALASNPGSGSRLLIAENAGVERYGGLRWAEENFLLRGDRISVSAASEVQLLAREMDVLQSLQQAELLSLLGWRSRLQLNWQLGEPQRQIQWQLVSRLDRRSGEANETIRLQALRRF